MLICNDINKLQYVSLGVTDDIINEENTLLTSTFQTSFFFDYYFEKEQSFKFNIFKDDQRMTETVTVGKIMGSRKLRLEILLPNLSKQCIEDKVALIIEANKKESNTTVNVNFNLSTLFNTHRIMNQFPMFYIISRRNNDGNWKKVYKSNEFIIIPAKLTILNRLLFNKNALIADKTTTFHQEMQIEFVNPVNMNSIGICSLDFFSLKDSLTEKNEITIRDPRGDSIGILYILYQEEMMTFVDYLKYGMDINLVVAIDYTASNGNPNDATSLHYVFGDSPNDYEKAIVSCGNIVANYDRRNMFPVYGFGGIPYGMNQVQHCFSINGQADSRISGMSNIASAYRQSLLLTKLSGPTFFYQVIKKVIDTIKAEQNENENKYYVLLLLTDGIINDMNETCDIIVEASTYPLSIIIIGIGNADFTLMDTLDGDDNLLTNSKGEVRKRDLVQFVRFNDFKNSCVQNASTLAAAVLEEIPKQVDDYYKLTGSFIKKSIEQMFV